jgi:polysaccharide pyruvyl transferase WcaK-like protein
MGLLRRIRDAFDPDKVLQDTMSAFIEAVAVKRALGIDVEEWKPGKPLKLCFAGYVGTRNTGADVRVEGMIRQVRWVLGDDDCELTIMTVDPELTAGYFRTVRQVELPVVFPKFLHDECPKHHGVIACEGSMFKSKFASALSVMMAGALGIANVEGKLSVGYGAEAGGMTPHLRDFVKKHCKQSLVICRNEPSRDVLGRLGIRTTGGADTAWTFDPAPLSVGADALRRAGWDGKQRVLVVCPINPFWWPVKPDIAKAVALKLVGQYKGEHYQSIYFHHSSTEATQKYETYLDAIAEGVRAFRSRRDDVFPILVAMEQLDKYACEDLAPRLDGTVPIFVSDSHDMFEMVSILRNCTWMLSSRFHAVVTSMPGLVASAGITMDERIRNLMNDRGHPQLFLEVDEADLADKVVNVLETLDRDREEVVHGIGRAVPKQLALMGRMGIDFMDEVARVYPEFPRRELPMTCDGHLPPLAPELQRLVERYG